ncbi:hypothetical protein PIB30_049327 [Stylosanthes scabra]|uniref:Uncharacterized protein n=1 Tax=Stylosanthes scabra TaxID=79078 RepID=A0ABU6XEZ7_9FABA|nr:hypothetical protein [Stylosanthes scabra]
MKSFNIRHINIYLLHSHNYCPEPFAASLIRHTKIGIQNHGLFIIIRRNAFDNHRFRTLFNQKLYEETVCHKEIIAEVGFNLMDNEYPEMRQQIALRGWRRLASPKEAAKTMIREFFANASRSEDEMDG